MSLKLKTKKRPKGESPPRNWYRKTERTKVTPPWWGLETGLRTKEFGGKKYWEHPQTWPNQASVDRFARFLKGQGYFIRRTKEKVDGKYRHLLWARGRVKKWWTMSLKPKRTKTPKERFESQPPPTQSFQWSSGPRNYIRVWSDKKRDYTYFEYVMSYDSRSEAMTHAKVIREDGKKARIKKHEGVVSGTEWSVYEELKS